MTSRVQTEAKAVQSLPSGVPVRRLALVAVSARMMAEAAARDGYEAFSIDLFGDADTRRASKAWWPAGAPGAMQLDDTRVLAALHELAQSGRVDGWVAGSGCEGWPDLLARGAALLPLVGCSPAAVRRVRDSQAFFGGLETLDVPHPPVRHSAPPDPHGWLVKDAHGCGGWHIRHADTLPQHSADEGSDGQGRGHQRGERNAIGRDGQHLGRPYDRPYYQRIATGTPMSATFCANGSDAVVLGLNELTVRAVAGRPYVYCGAIGPVPVADTALRSITRTVRLLSAQFELRGLCSLDFLLDGDIALVLEINPRPPASMALYPHHLAGGLMAAHVDACRRGRLPSLMPPQPTDRAVRGHEIVFATGPLQLDATGAQRLRNWPGCHDLPAAGATFERGDPVCSVGAAGTSAAQVRARLGEARSALLNTLETA